MLHVVVGPLDVECHEDAIFVQDFTFTHGHAYVGALGGIDDI
ncbi:hypothetical protein SDC9_90886 [bioreactor metagenome]|uniref:Uncharacterized protein n=1 Tax=bioreactor metagenome TaxID=1076179 RepID=A0A644ZUW1_9ZZZZ